MNDLPYRNTLKEPFAGESGRCSADERHYLLTDGSAGLLRCNIYDVSHNRALVQEWAIVFCVINKVVTMVGAEAGCRGGVGGVQAKANTETFAALTLGTTRRSYTLFV